MALPLRWICAVTWLILSGTLAAPVWGTGKYSIAPVTVNNMNGFVDIGWAVLNDAGIVAGNGHYNTGSDTVMRGGVLLNGTITHLGTLGGTGTFTYTMNASTQIIGTSNVAGLLPNGAHERAYLWQNGAMTDLFGHLGCNLPTDSRAQAINNAGDIVGVVFKNQPCEVWSFLRKADGTRIDIAPNTVGAGVNSSRQVVLQAVSPPGTKLWTDSNHDGLPDASEIINLGTLGGNAAFPFAINDAGVIVGDSSLANGTTHAYLWRDVNANGQADAGEMIDLTPNAVYGSARSINNAGQVLIITLDAQNKNFPYLYENGNLTLLNALIDPATGWDIISGISINNAGQILGFGMHNGTGKYFIATPARRPVFVIPGVGATYAFDVTNDLPWLIARGVDPSMLQIDPLARTYHDLIQTLENVGYTHGKDLFVVNYDWRLLPGPIDGAIDGTIAGLTATEISSGAFRYGVDYLGAVLKQAAQQWETDHPGDTLDAVDMIVHSTGGLVARSYIQSGAYGMPYSGAKKLPKVSNLIMIGVPNRGASKAWNPIHDNWVVDPAFEFVLAKIINRAYRKVLNGAVISGPDGNISLATISPPACVELATVCFVNQYVPTARALLATYDFIDFGAGFVNVNSAPASRNTLLLDLNAGLDLSLTGDPNAFGDLVLKKPTIIYGTNGGAPLGPIPGLPSGTPTAVQQKTGPAGGQFGFLSIASFEDIAPRDAAGGETWFHDVLAPVSGDGTVPLDSSAGQFIGDARFDLRPFTQNGNTTQSVGHTDLPFNTDVQKLVLDVLAVACPLPCSAISTGLSTLNPSAVQCAVTGCANFTLDPAEGFVVDNMGRRLGYSAATGPLTEIPGSVWYGNTDGMGWIFGPVAEPLTLQLTGLGGPYYAMVSVVGVNGRSGVIAQGVLGAGEPHVVPVTTANPALSVAKAGTGTGTVVSNVGTIDCGSTCSNTYIGGSTVNLAATPEAGSQFVGWLGPCTGPAGCQVLMGGPRTATATFAPSSLGAPKLDIDGNGAADALTDGLLIARFLQGLTGDALTAHAVGGGASRGAASIAEYFANIKPILDIDGNGVADPWTDGVLVVRYLFGLRGASLIAGAIAPTAIRQTPEAVASQIQSVLP